MNYSVINNLPIDFCYRDYSLESLKNNADWFFENKSTRLEILNYANGDPVTTWLTIPITVKGKDSE